MRKSRIHIVTMLAGTLLALAMTFSQFAGYEKETSAVKATTEQSSEPSEAPCITLPSFSLPSSVHVKAGLDAHCLFEILFEADDQPPYVEREFPAPAHFLARFLRAIISPNAP